MSKTITVTVKDEYFEEFLNELEKKIEEDDEICEEDVKIHGLSVKEYRKAMRENSKQ